MGNATIACTSSTKIGTYKINVSGETYSSTSFMYTVEQDDKTTEKTKMNQSNGFTSSRLSANVASSAIGEDEEKSNGNNIETTSVFILPPLLISFFIISSCTI